MKLSLFHKNKQQHILYSLWNRKWAYISYIPEVYYKKKNQTYLLSHQNKREALIIGKVFFSLGYNVKVALFNAAEECDERRYDIIFGLEPNFMTMSSKNPQALKIYYATGAYWEHQFNMVKNRTDQFNRKHGLNLPYLRSGSKHDSCDIADAIFQIGSKFTIQTYPVQLQNKIKIIDQSSNFTQQCDVQQKLSSVSTADFIWFGSEGSILKGLDLVLDYFKEHPQYQLHVVGPIDKEFMEYYKEHLKECSNILFYGFLNTCSEQFMNLAYRCCFNIFPSGSEGCPGSVITLMQVGVIPITSRWGAFDGIEDLGYLLPELTTDAIDKAIRWANELSRKELDQLITKNIAYSKSTWNLELFEKEFTAALQEEISRL